jgi:hypothetical protein
MRKLLGLLLLTIALSAAPGLRAETRCTLESYALDGTVLGGLVGCVAATVPYLNDQQGFDYVVGAGVGAVSGAVFGLILGSLDVASQRSQAASTPDPQNLRLSLAPLPKGGGAVYVCALF